MSRKKAACLLAVAILSILNLGSIKTASADPEFTPPNSAGDTTADRQKAVAHYFKIVPVKKAIEDTLTQIATQFPPQQREQYVRTAMAGMRVEVIEAAAAGSMANRFTTSEINALSAFLETPEGRSAMEKMKFYTADIMPVFQQELMRVMQASMQNGAGSPGYAGGYPQNNGYPGAGDYNQGGNPQVNQPAGYSNGYQGPPQQGGYYRQQGAPQQGRPNPGSNQYRQQQAPGYNTYGPQQYQNGGQ